ncbi:MAG: ACT domain-containing protein [Calditrichia bacterium]
MEKIKELFVILENRPGTAGELCRVLKKKRISIYAIGIFMDTARIYLSHPEKALEALREHGYEVDVRDVLRISLPNKQGALMELTMKMGNAGINIEYLYGALEEKQKKGTIILEVDNPDLALELFRNHKF